MLHCQLSDYSTYCNNDYYLVVDIYAGDEKSLVYLLANRLERLFYHRTEFSRRFNITWKSKLTN